MQDILNGKTMELKWKNKYLMEFNERYEKIDFLGKRKVFVEVDLAQSQLSIFGKEKEVKQAFTQIKYDLKVFSALDST